MTRYQPPHCRPTGHHPHIPHQLLHQPHHPTVGRLVITQTTPSADWSSPEPYCWPTGHHPHIPRRLPHQPHHPTVGRLVITPMYPVGHPINPTTPLLADWSSPTHTPSAAPSAPPPHCWPTGHHPKHTVSQLVITPTYPVGRPISSPTPMSANPLLVLLLCGRPHPLNRC